jgi:hypothetical protein
MWLFGDVIVSSVLLCSGTSPSKHEERYMTGIASNSLVNDDSKTAMGFN